MGFAVACPRSAGRRIGEKALTFLCELVPEDRAPVRIGLRESIELQRRVLIDRAYARVADIPGHS